MKEREVVREMGGRERETEKKKKENHNKKKKKKNRERKRKKVREREKFKKLGEEGVFVRVRESEKVRVSERGMARGKLRARETEIDR